MERNNIANLAIVCLVIGILGVGSITVVQQMSFATLDAEYQDLLSEYEVTDFLLETILGDYDEMEDLYQLKITEYGQLITTYNLLLSEQETLQTDYDQLILDFNILQGEYDALLMDYTQLQADYSTLQDDYDLLSDSYAALQAAIDSLNSLYSALDASYTQLQSDFDALQLSYDTITTWIRQQILPAQYMVFAEAVRRYYFEDFYVQDKFATGNETGYWTEFTRFCRDVVLHDSQRFLIGETPLEGMWFPDVSNALADCLRYGNQTERLAYQNFYWSFYDWLPNWAGFALPVNDLDAITQVTQWCIDNIDYEYDSDITTSQEPYGWDYIKFPVETAFRTMGDCEDQAMLTAAYLESCGFETTIATFHDDNFDFYHGVLVVHIEDTTEFWNRYPTTSLWNLGPVDPYTEFTWCWIDTTWDTPFGTEPAWLSYYVTNGMSYSDVTIAICDLDAEVSYTSSGTGIGASMP